MWYELFALTGWVAACFLFFHARKMRRAIKTLQAEQGEAEKEKGRLHVLVTELRQLPYLSRGSVDSLVCMTDVRRLIGSRDMLLKKYIMGETKSQTTELQKYD